MSIIAVYDDLPLVSSGGCGDHDAAGPRARPWGPGAHGRMAQPGTTERWLDSDQTLHKRHRKIMENLYKRYKWLEFRTSRTTSKYVSHINTYQYISIHINTYQYISIHINTYQYISIHINTYQYISKYLHS